MRDWLITYYHSIPFVFGVVGVFQHRFRPAFPEGDFFIVTKCTMEELPYPFWLCADRTVWVTNPEKMQSEFQKILDSPRSENEEDSS